MARTSHRRIRRLGGLLGALSLAGAAGAATPATGAVPRPTQTGAATQTGPMAAHTAHNSVEKRATATAVRRDPRAVPSTGGVRLAPTARGALTGRTIVVDPGHNGRYVRAVNTSPVPDGRGGRKACNTSGTASVTGYSEHAHNWAVATKLAATLRAQGAVVWLTRPDDRGVGPCVDERAAIGNRVGADLVLSIHADGAAASARGFHVIRSTVMAGGPRVTARSARLATITRDHVARVTGMPRSTYLGAGTAITPRRDIAGMNHSRVPAVLLEAGNMRNRTDARLLRSPAFQAEEAAALAGAAREFLRG